MIKSAALGGWLSCSLAALFPIAGCVDASEKISTSLTAYGLNGAQSRCVGDRLEQGLTFGQLQQLGRAVRAYSQGDTTPGRLTVSDLLRISKQITDIKIPIEVAKAAARCGILTSAPASPASTEGLTDSYKS
jgi:hypothetical protein